MRTRAKYPPLPTEIEAPCGPVKIVLKHPITDDGTVCWGLWQSPLRLVNVDPTATLEYQWRVLFHELTHIALDEGGLSEMMTAEMQEAVCWAVAAQRMKERFG